MRKILLLVLAVLIVWIIFNRERIYVRDPMASVFRDKTKLTGMEVYINPSNDILLREKSGSGSSKDVVVQHWDKMPGTPSGLVCMQWMACLSPDDHVPTLALPWNGKGEYEPDVTMNGRIITFIDTAGKHVRVEL